MARSFSFLRGGHTPFLSGEIRFTEILAFFPYGPRGPGCPPRLRRSPAGTQSGDGGSAFTLTFVSVLAFFSLPIADSSIGGDGAFAARGIDLWAGKIKRLLIMTNASENVAMSDGTKNGNVSPPLPSPN